ncbi:hypothetical protein ABS751_10410 [Bacillus subtilis]|uniref:hypothetical protein n=1 Tax=Bacillus subtilis TaxID=1423 RepID=UPI000EF28328|nr:hypothetical protein [Bacillus subtilis]AYK68300.1 hypothetical protein D9C11_23585 [Bacillus subtilis subsp. subtilis]MDO3655373.1 hypothetical protein [Bacillus subtilis]MEC0400843.1 hypothetical protein [Bacillus subtilis]QAW06687.1 hypothetical protein ES968_22265 [Bacillus subtilis]
MPDSPITKIEQKIKKLENQLKAQDKFKRDEARRQRTRRLIEIGGKTQKYFELEHNSIEEIEEILFQFSEYVKHNKLDKHKKDQGES